MASSLTLDLEHLLSPIPGEPPSGTDPRSDTSPTSPYQITKDARYAAADAERGLERGFAESADAKRAEATAKQSWPLILATGTTLIASTAKDLEVAAWVTEALLRLHRIAGLRDGLLLIEGLVKQYWDGLFPLPDEDGLETRLAALAGLSGGEAEGRLIHPLKQVPLTEGDDPPIAYWQYEIAASVRSGQADGSVTAADFSNRLHHSSPQFVRDLMDDAQACVDAVTRLDVVLAANCGNESPSFSRLRETLSDILDALRLHAPASTIADPEAAAEPVDASAPTAEDGQTPGSGQTTTARILDRQGAFRQLEELAAFFRRTEPHSPIAYAIENLVRRGRMSFPELIEELIVDDSARRTYFINAGIQPPPDGSDS